MSIKGALVAEVVAWRYRMLTPVSLAGGFLLPHRGGGAHSNPAPCMQPRIQNPWFPIDCLQSRGDHG
eukprot:gene17805-biopygen11413